MQKYSVFYYLRHYFFKINFVIVKKIIFAAGSVKILIVNQVQI